MANNKFCTECGNQTKRSAKFCESCGFEFVSINKEESSVSSNKNPNPQNNSSSQWTQLPTSNFLVDQMWLSYPSSDSASDRVKNYFMEKYGETVDFALYFLRIHNAGNKRCCNCFNTIFFESEDKLLPNKSDGGFRGTYFLCDICLSERKKIEDEFYEEHIFTGTSAGIEVLVPVHPELARQIESKEEYDAVINDLDEVFELQSGKRPKSERFEANIVAKGIVSGIRNGSLKVQGNKLKKTKWKLW